MRFPKTGALLLFCLLFSTPAWGQPANWAISVTRGSRIVGTSSDSLGTYNGQPYVLAGIDHISWYYCWFGHLCTDDPSAFEIYSVPVDYYDCDGTLLESWTPTGGWRIVRGTGGLSGGIGGLSSNPVCFCDSTHPPAEVCRVYVNTAPVKRSSDYCTTWPELPPVDPEKSAGGGAGQGQRRGCSLEGNPVNVATGNKYEEVLDLSVSTPGLPLEFRRSYNNQVPDDGPLGYGWTHNYALRIEVVETGPTTRVRIWDSDGRAHYLGTIRATNPDETPFSSESGIKDRLTQTVSTGEYTFSRREGNLTYKFSSEGALTEISDPNGNTLTFTHTGGLLTGVSNNFGKSISIQYNGEGRISSVTGPNGQSVVYEYTNGDLTRITYPDTNSISYAYLNHNLTDKYDTNNNLVGHWDYNGYGRVITYYSHLKEGVPQERIDFSYSFDKTVVTKSTGVTTYSIGNIRGIQVVKEIGGCSI